MNRRDIKPRSGVSVGGRILPTVPKGDAESHLDNLNSTQMPSFLALPDARVRFPARFCVKALHFAPMFGRSLVKEHTREA